MQSKFNEVSKAVGICWLTIAVLCQAACMTGSSVAVWIALMSFHAMNSVSIIVNTKGIDFDSFVSLMFFVLCVYGYKGQKTEVVSKKVD